MLRESEVNRGRNPALSLPKGTWLHSRRMDLSIQRRIRHRLVMHRRGMLVDGGGGLGTLVAVARIEIQRADMVGAVAASKPHAALDARDAIKALHGFSLVFLCHRERNEGSAAKVM
jgi:hypothetical protein